MSAGGRALGAGDGSDGGHEIAEEFRGVVRVDDVGRASAEMQFVEQFRYEGGGVAIEEGDQDDNQSW